MSPADNIKTITGAPEGFSTVTFNLRFGLADDGVNSWDHRKKGLAALFHQYRPDFIGLQEANDFQIDYLADILAGYGFIGKYSPAPPNWQSNVIFFKSQWKPTFYQHFFLSPTPSIPSRFRDSRWPRQCTIGMFANRHRRLICINTHFDFAEDVQTKSARLIMAQLSRLPSQAPAILLGDFNATPEHTCYGVFTGGDPNAPPGGPFFKNAAEKPFPGTYHGFNGRSNGEHIDWILYRGPIAPVAYRVEESRFAGVYPSDHFPVFATFRWIVSKKEGGGYVNKQTTRKLPALNKRFETITLNIREKHGIRRAGFRTTLIGRSNQVRYYFLNFRMPAYKTRNPANTNDIRPR